jgi:hypothetical protein
VLNPLKAADIPIPVDKLVDVNDASVPVVSELPVSDNDVRLLMPDQ